ncbi:MAG TPA: CapA family protein [Candidatus Hydrogenedentes bacterium]|nr:CapA family protein [Candidatus Hydrogenedentota bacterium]HPG70097.1 CapA family protein [Candidatus Hydrogenedentota bacterium]
MKDSSNRRAFSVAQTRPFFALTILAAAVLAPAVLVSCEQTQADPTTQAPAPEVVAPKEVELVFVGDVMLARNVARRVRASGENFADLFADVSGPLQAADIAFCNVECCMSERGKTGKRKHAFRAPPQAVEGLTAAGFDVVSLSNNHSLDFGEEAATDTVAVLKDAGIRAVGLRAADSAQEPVIIERNGVTLGFLAYCTPRWNSTYGSNMPIGPAVGDKETLKRDITALRHRVDVLVVSMHWGMENATEPNDIQRDLAQYMVDLGVDIIAGHHPHVLQDPEVIDRTLVLYSMGNFVFDQHWDTHRQSRLYRVRVNQGGFIGAEYMPLEIALAEWRPKPTADDFTALGGPVAALN